MLDDVTLTCSMNPFGHALTARNVIVDESEKIKILPFEAPTQCQSSVSPVPQFPVIFLRICYDDDDDVITEFATSCPLLVL